MEYPQQIVTEITAPNNLPFAPGNLVIGIGSTVPPELSAAGFTNALVLYDQDWNPASTTPLTKFKFISSSGSSFIIGYGLVTNPSVSQTAVIRTAMTVGMLPQGGIPATDVEIYNQNNHSIFEVTSAGTNNADTYLELRNDSGALHYLFITATDPNHLTIDAPLKLASYWGTYTLALGNGWTGTLLAYKDGAGNVTIQSNGNLTSPVNPGLFQVLAALPAGMVPTMGKTVQAQRCGSPNGITGIGSDGTNVYIDHGNASGMIPSNTYVFVNLSYPAV